MSQPALRLHSRSDEDPRRGFRSPQDFLLSCIEDAGRSNRESLSDERLVPLAKYDDAGPGLAFMLPAGFTPQSLKAAAGSDEQGAYSDTFGGFLVPPATVHPGILSAVTPDPTAGRTRAFPMGSPRLAIPARTDKDHATSLTGGFQVSRLPETIEIPASRGAMELVTLTASSLVGLDYATEEILTDSVGSFAALLAAGFRDEMGGTLLREKIRGLGGNEYLGVLNSPAKIEVDKASGQAADTIVGANIVTMRRRCWGYPGAIWLANPDTFEQLAAVRILTGEGPISLYQPSHEEGKPDMLAGGPIFYTEHCPTLGDAGDLLLCRWSEYLEGMYVPFKSEESVHVRFLNHERTFRFSIRNAGAPWWRSALTPEVGADTLSPIVTLAARA